MVARLPMAVGALAILIAWGGGSANNTLTPLSPPAPTLDLKVSSTNQGGNSGSAVGGSSFKRQESRPYDGEAESDDSYISHGPFLSHTFLAAGFVGNGIPYVGTVEDADRITYNNFQPNGSVISEAMLPDSSSIVFGQSTGDTYSLTIASAPSLNTISAMGISISPDVIAASSSKLCIGSQNTSGQQNSVGIIDISTGVGIYISIPGVNSIAMSPSGGFCVVSTNTSTLTVSTRLGTIDESIPVPSSSVAFSSENKIWLSIQGGLYVTDSLLNELASITLEGSPTIYPGTPVFARNETLVTKQTSANYGVNSYLLAVNRTTYAVDAAVPFGTNDSSIPAALTVGRCGKIYGMNITKSGSYYDFSVSGIDLATYRILYTEAMTAAPEGTAVGLNTIYVGQSIVWCTPHVYVVGGWNEGVSIFEFSPVGPPGRGQLPYPGNVVPSGQPPVVNGMTYEPAAVVNLRSR